MRFAALFLIVFLASLISYGQEECVTQVLHEYLMESDELYRTQFETPIDIINRIADTGQVVTVPVVVHVIHLGENIGSGSNMPASKINGAISKLNQNFRIANNINVGIQFCLAQVDPNGLPTDGIDRVDGRVIPDYESEGVASSSSNTGIDNLEVSNLTRWPTDQYYNIYVVHDIQGASAFAYYPQASPFNRDGTFIETSSMSNTSPTLTHELGHTFNLRHTFNGDNDGNSCPANNNCETDGDFVCDTDPHKRSNCIFANTCQNNSPNWANTWRNYMSYCGTTSRFTNGQKDRARAAAFSYGSRTVLWENVGVCDITYALDGAIVSIDYPIDGIINEVCGSAIEAEFTFRNEGSSKIIQFSVDYNFDDFSSSASFTTDLAYGEAASFVLPSYTANPNQAVNELTIEISNVNESADENGLNDSKSIAFGINDTCVTTGWIDQLQALVEVYPSPNRNGVLYIEGIPAHLNLSIEISDISGRLIMQKSLVKANEVIDIQNLSKGTYLITFKKDDILFTKKFLRM